MARTWQLLSKPELCLGSGGGQQPGSTQGLQPAQSHLPLWLLGPLSPSSLTLPGHPNPLWSHPEV